MKYLEYAVEKCSYNTFEITNNYHLKNNTDFIVFINLYHVIYA